MTFEMKALRAGSKADRYRELREQAAALLHGETDAIACAANLSALIFHTLPDLNWAGFYFLRDEELVVGPFQGKPACVRIALGRGVCGAAASRRETVIVKNVNDFPGHIACDPASQSEIVVPLVNGPALLGVLDLDSPQPGRFDEADRAGLEALAALWVTVTQPAPWPGMRRRVRSRRVRS